MTLRERINAALVRVAHGHAPMRIPADPTDVDLVLADCEKELDALAAQLAAALEVLPWLIEKARTADGHDASTGPAVDCAQCGALGLAEDALHAPAAAAEALLERVRAEEREACVASVAKRYWPPSATERITAWNEALDAAIATIRARGKR
jgi:hypothetical protein